MKKSSPPEARSLAAVLVMTAMTVGVMHGCGGDDTMGAVTPDDGGAEASLPDGVSLDDAGTGADATKDGAPPIDATTDAGPFFSNPRLGVANGNGVATVNAILHAGTSWYIGGSFNRVSPYGAPNLVAIETSAGAGLAAPVGCPLKGGFNGDVSAIARTATAIYVGGSFTTYQGASANRIAKIDPATCALDATFSPAAANGFNDVVSALSVSATDVYVGGAFTTYRGVANSANRLAKLNLATGAIDAAFSPPGATANGFNNTVAALVVTATDVYAGGTFTQYKGAAGSALRIAKLNLATGALDTTFSPAGNNGFNLDVGTLALSANDVYVGGAFTAYRGVNNSARGIAKLNLTTGAIDTTFSPAGAPANGFDGVVHALAVSGTDVYVGGAFTAYKGVATSAMRLAKLNLTTGAIDATFSPTGATANGFDSVVRALALSGASLYAGGDFGAYRGLSQSAIRFAKLDAGTGAIDPAFLPAGSNVGGFAGPAAATVSVAVISGTTLWLGGRFSLYAGNAAQNLAKVDDVKLAVDAAFSPRVDAVVRTLAASGASLYAGGDFTAYKGAANSANRIAKLDLATGAIDATFSPVGATANGFDGAVLALAANATDVYVGGDFRAYRGVATSSNRLAKLNAATGAIDTTFSPAGAATNGFNDVVRALALSATHLYAGGDFTAYRGAANSALRLARLDATTGAIDAAFSPPGATTNGFNAVVDALAINATDLYVGGDFTSYKGAVNSANRIAKLGLTTGALDPVFNPPGLVANGFTDGNSVLALALTSTGVYAGGQFTAYKGVANSANRIAKLGLATGAIDTTFDPTGAPNGYDGDVLALGAGTSTCASGCGTVILTGGAYTQYRGEISLGLTVLDPGAGAVK